MEDYEIQTNNLSTYHALSTRVSRAFDQFIFEEIAKRSDSSILNDLYQKHFQKKVGTNHQRVAWVFIAAKYFGIDIEEKFDELIKLSAVPELLIRSEYCFNWLTDGKNGAHESHYDANIILITCQYLLTEALYFLPDRMLRRYLELYRWGIYGCLVVETELRITNWEKMRSKDFFWKQYSDNHCIPDVGALYAYCFELVHDYFELNIPKEQLRRIYQVGFDFGRGIQINGDLSDFIIPNKEIATTEKRPIKDYFIDIRTDRLTYPSWLLLRSLEQNNDNELFEEVITSSQKRNYPDSQFYEKVHAAMRKYQVPQEILKFLRLEKKRLTKEISEIGIKNEGSDLWRTSMVLLVNNKFQKTIRTDYQLNK